MTTGQPLDALSVRTPSTVDWRSPLNDVHDGLFRLAQLPLDVQVTPAAWSCAAAWAWVRRVAGAAAVAPLTATPSANQVPPARTRVVRRCRMEPRTMFARL